MTATTEGRMTLRRDADQFSFPVKGATKVPAGVLAAIDTTGMLVNAGATATLKVVGVTESDADNTAGADGAISGQVRRGCYQFANSSSTDQITLADVNASCYVVDNQTVAKTSNSSARPVAGVIRDVDTNGVWVQI